MDLFWFGRRPCVADIRLSWCFMNMGCTINQADWTLNTDWVLIRYKFHIYLNVISFSATMLASWTGAKNLETNMVNNNVTDSSYRMINHDFFENELWGQNLSSSSNSKFVSGYFFVFYCIRFWYVWKIGYYRSTFESWNCFYDIERGQLSFIQLLKNRRVFC